MRITEEEGGGAPTNNSGGLGAPAGLQGMPPVDQEKYKKKPNILRRRKPNFGAAAVFEVSADLFYSLREQKRKGKHWRTYLNENDVFYEIREYANTHPHKPIMIQNERSGEMCMIKYKGTDK